MARLKTTHLEVCSRKCGSHRPFKSWRKSRREQLGIRRAEAAKIQEKQENS